MLKIIRNFLPIFVLFALALACVSPGAPGAPGLDQNAINLAIEQTSAAAGTQTAQAQPISTISLTPTLTRFPTMTPLPTFTPVVFVTLMRVIKNTNCRAGPGKVYPVVAGFRAGDFAEVVGRSANSAYWIVRNPTHPEKVCWLAGNLKDITGIVGALKVMTPPPTPKPTRTNTPEPKPTAVPATTTVPSSPVASLTATPAIRFTAAYNNMGICTGTSWWPEFRLQNTGVLTFQSLSITVADLTTPGPTLNLDSDDFINQNGCGSSDIMDTLDPVTTWIVSGPAFTYDFTGHNLDVSVTLCTEPGQGGTCVTQILNFTP